MPSPASPESLPTVVFIGGGNMARSLVGGLLAGGADPSAIRVADPNADARAALASSFGVPTFASAAEAVEGAATWVFAVKPQVMRAVCTDLAATAQQARPLVVSIAAGITSAQIQRWLGAEFAVVRAMPNTPALLGVGATGLYANERVDDAGRAAAEALMQACGLACWIPGEDLMDAVTAVSGSGPAYVFLLAEAMQEAARAQGLAADTARLLVLQTLLGAARMLTETGEEAATLRQRVTSPGGTTQAALETFEAGGFRQLVDAAIAAATRRGRELSAGG